MCVCTCRCVYRCLRIYIVKLLTLAVQLQDLTTHIEYTCI